MDDTQVGCTPEPGERRHSIRSAWKGQFQLAGDQVDYRPVVFEGSEAESPLCRCLNLAVDPFEREGNLLTMFGSKGSGHGQFMGPETLAVDNNELYVLDKGTNRVQVFSLET